MKPTEMVGVGGSAGPQGRVVKVETRSPAVGEDGECFHCAAAAGRQRRVYLEGGAAAGSRTLCGDGLLQVSGLWVMDGEGLTRMDASESIIMLVLLIKTNGSMHGVFVGLRCPTVREVVFNYVFYPHILVFFRQKCKTSFSFSCLFTKIRFFLVGETQVMSCIPGLFFSLLCSDFKKNINVSCRSR
ncbi:hypothetical protein XENOCAPTIV_001271 [Xenoophorus captivus]|uniref:Uncharacterized protein n=1 Tax=Xenoophorus captivus TaxID=1517983 RepID=A0ABV0Q4X8_9TELE